MPSREVWNCAAYSASSDPEVENFPIAPNGVATMIHRFPSGPVTRLNRGFLLPGYGYSLIWKVTKIYLRDLLCSEFREPNIAV